MALTLTKLPESTATKIVLGWTPVAGAVGYRFQSSSQAPKWSHTWDSTRSKVTFSKADWYKVEALGVKDSGQYSDAEPPPPSTPDTWDQVLLDHFPLTAFTPTRTVTVTSAAALNSAIANIQAGDEINASNFTYNGSFQIRDKNLSDWAEINFTNVNFVGSGTSDVFVFWNSSKIRCFGADVSGGGYGMRMFDCVDVEFRGTVHDVGATGVHVIPTSTSYSHYRSPTRCVVVAECYNCGLNHSLDPHAEKGTGLHSAYIGKSGALPVVNCKFAIDGHDQSNCAGGIQFTNTTDSILAARMHDLTFEAQSQVAGNAIQTFGSNILRNRIVYIEADNITGHGFDAGGSGGSLGTNAVEYGRATNFSTNPDVGNFAWDTAGGIQYVDVDPQSFGTD